jgi:FkbM family methyltransferase
MIKLGEIKLIRFMAPYGIIKRREQDRRDRVQSVHQESLYRQLIAPDSTVFDIGANVGNRIEALLKCGARVVAVDPQPDCVRILRRTFRNRISVVQAAVGSAPGRHTLYFGEKADTKATLSPDFIAQANKTKRFDDHEWNRTIEVDIITLDSLIAKHGVPRFIKIDVEGFEFEVLRGLSQPVDVLSFEWTSDMPESANKCIDYLSGLGMDHFQLSLGESMSWTNETSRNAATIKEVLTFLGRESLGFGDIYASRKPLARRPE